jgi:FxsC-like protein
MVSSAGSMAYYDFFLSFASADWRQGAKDDLKIFFAGFEAKLKAFGFNGRGFFSSRDIGRGQDWEKELLQVLPASHVIVPAYSPNYFKSVWCGREWEVFWRRQQENRLNPPLDVTAEEVMLPLIWTGEFLDLPPRVPTVQYKAPVSDAPVYTDRGLGYLMQSPKKYPGKYEDFVHRFATELGKMIRNQGANKMRKLPDVYKMDLPFPDTYKWGLKHVRYVFLAGRHDEMQNLRQTLTPYGQFESRRDWRPCFPTVDRSAGDIARAIAQETGKDGYEFVEPADAAALMRTLREANDRNNVIAVLVDPWSLTLHAFREFAEKFDGESFPTSGVIVTWNGNDGETPDHLPILKNRLANHFGGRAARQEYYNPAVNTPEELREAIVATFVAAQERLLATGQIHTSAGGAAAAQPLLQVAP